ncbi:MAG: hypothetical protein H6855_04310 [Rhodospirillales bacterium]|nr:hypothetical protein [Rhodospirillales bacterium]MCB9965287.1 hypothetical protein [Rhodospirillales bacterium]MCB9972944.1 hypothetical protein [Rhodospirillales bacterium]MCB9980118.1 hypothetical protein [Rhodospirillales bacterium]
MFSFLKLSFFLFVLVAAPSVMAAEQADARFSKKDGYERLVFEWSTSAPPYHLEQAADVLSISFNSPVQISVEQVLQAESKFIAGIHLSSPEKIDIKVRNFLSVRDLRVGNKIILDIYGDDTAPPPSVPSSSTSSSGATKEKSKLTSVDRVRTPSVKTPHQKQEKEKAEEPKEPTPTILQSYAAQAKEAKPLVFVLSATDGIKLAAYERFGALWVVTNRIDLPVQPYLEGEGKESVGPIETYKVADGTATLWKIPLPEKASVHGEGGSLYWQLMIGTNLSPQPVSPISFEKEREPAATGSEALRSGQVGFSVQGDVSLLSFDDPELGDRLSVVLVDTSEVYQDTEQHMVDFEVLKSPVGVAILLNNPEVRVEKKAGKVTISAPEGLILTPAAEVSKTGAAAGHGGASGEGHIYDFSEWQMGPESAFFENQRILMSSLRGKTLAGRAERILSVAKLNLAHGRGAEAIGLTEYAATIFPDLARSPAYSALHGAGTFLAGQYDRAIEDFFHPGLAHNPEIDLWKAVTFARLGDWQQAIENLPDNFDVLSSYPDKIAVPLTLSLAEIFLRNGDKAQGEELLHQLEARAGHLTDTQEKGVRYLQAEVLRQNGDTAEAVSVWSKLAQEENPYYQTKAELALVTLGLENKTLTPEDAVNRLENLRYVWRGDDLEIQVLRRLGLSQIEMGRYLDGFKTLRDTVVLTANNAFSDAIADLMRKTYEDIFLTDKIETVPPLDAAALYEEFRELTPAGEKGDHLVARLAERLVDADMFDRAAKLLAYQIDYRLHGEEAVSTALRMASIQLMDRRPKDALETLAKAETLLTKQNFSNKALKQKDLDLLQARALSDSGDVSRALDQLRNMDPPARDISQLAADIAWKSGRWNEAATFLRDLIADMDLPRGKEVSEENARLLLNYAIALNLSDQQVELRNLRERHLAQMKGTTQEGLFEVVTRPRQDVMLGDRDSMMKVIGETEIFTDFLEKYKAE